MSISKQNGSDGNPTVDELKQSLDSELSQLVRDYESRGLPASDIVDSVLWHAEVAASRSKSDDMTVGQYTTE